MTMIIFVKSFLEAAKRLKKDPADCLVIEDSVYSLTSRVSFCCCVFDSFSL